MDSAAISNTAPLVVLFTAGALVALWRGKVLSPNLLLILSMLFLQGNLELLLTLVSGELPETLDFIELADLKYATLLFDLSLLAIAGGMWLCHRSISDRQAKSSTVRHLGTLSNACVGFGAVGVYAVLLVITAFLKILIHGPLSPLAQLLIPFTIIRFFPIYLLAYRYFTTGRDGPYLLGIATFEIVANLSFFASFKELFVVLAGALILAIRHGARIRWLPATTVAISMVLIMSTWSSVKADFREFLSGGERAQIDTRTLGEKLDFLHHQFVQIGFADLVEGFRTSVLRIAYNGFFAATTAHVPDRMEHTDGTHLLTSAAAAVMPRFLFPDKPAIDDSEIVMLYTGMTVAGAAEGTSINIGQFGELYADLGVLGMLVAFAVWGAAVAGFEKMIVRRLGPGLDASAWAAIFVVIYAIGMFSLPKFIAGFLYSSVAVYLLFRFVYPELLRLIPSNGARMPQLRKTVG